MGFRLRLLGEYACFPRPEFRRDRVSYDIITPRAARGILENLYWRPEIRWQIDAIHVLSPILFEERQYEPSSQREPRNTHENAPLRMRILKDVDYLIEAHFDLQSPDEGNSAQHTKMIFKRARQRRYFREPYLGGAEFPARLTLMEKDESFPVNRAYAGQLDLGWMVHDIDAETPPNLRFFRACLVDGRMIVPGAGSADLLI
jgi:CRISPR-associated protein Cas5d